MAEPGGTAAIGPYPPGVGTDEQREEYDRLRRRVLWAMPYGLYVLGSTDRGERRNAMTINFVSQLGFDPKLIGVGVEKTAFTHELVVAGGCFSVCFVARDDRDIVRKFTKPVDVDLGAKTLNGFEYLERVTGAPVLARSVAFVDCELRDTLDVGTHSFFVGEVIDAAFLRDEDTPILRMEDTRMNYGG